MSETTQTFKNYIGGEWVAAADGRTTENRDPATGALLGHFPRSGQADVERAVAAAKTAFEGWRRTPAPKRGEMLYRVGALLAERKEEIARIMTREMGKVLVETRGDVQEAIDTAYLHGWRGAATLRQDRPVRVAEQVGHGLPRPDRRRRLSSRRSTSRSRSPRWKMLAGAHRRQHRHLQAGRGRAALGAQLVEILLDAGLPPDVVNWCMGRAERGHAAGRHPDVPVISFTGSTRSGAR